MLALALRSVIDWSPARRIDTDAVRVASSVDETLDDLRELLARMPQELDRLSEDALRRHPQLRALRVDYLPQSSWSEPRAPESSCRKPPPSCTTQHLPRSAMCLVDFRSWLCPGAREGGERTRDAGRGPRAPRVVLSVRDPGGAPFSKPRDDSPGRDVRRHPHGPSRRPSCRDAPGRGRGAKCEATRTLHT